MRDIYRVTVYLAAGTGIFSFPAAVAAAPVTLSATVTNSCTLTVTTAGVLVAAADGRSLSSEQSSGNAATLGVTATGTAPTINFSAPTASTPAGAAADVTAAIRYSSASGANQAYTSDASAGSSALIDSFTIHARLTSDSGFSGGNYSVNTVATCQQ